MKEQISFPDFQKVDMRIGTIKSAEKIEGSEKLIKLMVDLGEETERQILAGIAPYIENVESLVGKQIPVVTNLEPRKMMGIESQGMILAADNEGKPILMHPVEETPPGSQIR